MATPYPHPVIAREGWPFVGIAVGVALVVGFALGGWWSVPFWLVALFVLFSTGVGLVLTARSQRVWSTR